MNLQLQDELKDKEGQIRLLPDLQRRAAEADHALKEAEARELEAIALKKQVGLLKEEEARREREISTLKSRLQSLESVQTESQIAQNKARELETQLELLKERDEEKLRLADRRLRSYVARRKIKTRRFKRRFNTEFQFRIDRV